MEFRYNNRVKAYVALVHYMNNYIQAVCDTGASSTAMDLNSLRALTNDSKRCNALNSESIVPTGQIRTASGELNKVALISLNNIRIGREIIPTLYSRVIIGNAGAYEPMMLIGLDIIRRCEVSINRDRIILDSFQYGDYIEDNKAIDKSVIKIYSLS